MKQRISLLIILTALVTISTSAADFRKEVGGIEVIADGAPLAIPFYGGVNIPKPRLLDYDGDGLLDLFIVDQDGRLAYLRNVGSPTQPTWDPVSWRFADLDVGTWAILADIDADGDFDLFCDSRSSGAAFYRNESIGQTLDFRLEDTAFGGFNTEFNNTPAFVDLDGDNDLDFFYGNTGGFLEFYRNDGDSATPSFSFITGFYDSVYAFPGGLGGPAPGLATGVEHGFSNISFADIDADRDLDLFWGDLFNFSLYFFPNLGDTTESALQLQSESYMPSPTQGFNHATFGDLDGDNDLDLLIGVAVAADINALRRYINIGDSTFAEFEEIDLNLLDQIDLGSSAVPTAGDIDGDGDHDILIGAMNGQLTFMENTGSPVTPQFVLGDGTWQGISPGSNAAPVWIDLDHDNDLDLIVGYVSGRIAWYRNDGTPRNPVMTEVTTSLADIKVDQLALPQLADLNGDGLVDLLVGEFDFNGLANLRLYANTGDSANPVFSEITRSLLPIDTRRQTVPSLTDWDNDGRIDLILGTDQPGLMLYRNVADSGNWPDSTTLLPQPDTIAAFDDGRQLTVLMLDIDDDGDRDLLVGEQEGGLNFHRALGTCCVGTVGNVDADSTGTVDLADLTRLIDHLFISFVPLACAPEANVTIIEPGRDRVGLDDLSGLIDHLFITFAPLATCPD